MSKLVFKSEDVKGIMEHVVSTNEAKLMLVKDEGVYLLSPSFRLDDKSIVAYADGFNPSINEDWYDIAHLQLGGDDFADELDTEFAKQVLEQIEVGNQSINIIITSTSIKLGKPKIKATITLVPNKPTNEIQTETNEDEKPTLSETPKIVETTIKAGTAIREKFQQLVNEGKVTDDVLKILTDTELTKQHTSIRYAFLLEYDGNRTVKDQGSINGHIRYSSKLYEVNDKTYLMTNDIYSRNIEKFMNWSNGL